jgi:hypothetical protein
MSDESRSEDVLRRSLDTIDAVRRRVFLAGLVAVAGTLLAFYWLSHVARTGDVKSVMMSAVLALTCLIAWSTFGMAIFITRMTRTILRAIDLSARPSPR